ncbi:ras-associated and pleckstrin homology domains-containing protein 1-like isoform X2 [Lampetra planeri]
MDESENEILEACEEGANEFDQMFGDFLGELEELTKDIDRGIASDTTISQPAAKLNDWPTINLDDMLNDSMGLDTLMADLCSMEEELSQMTMGDVLSQEPASCPTVTDQPPAQSPSHLYAQLVAKSPPKQEQRTAAPLSKALTPVAPGSGSPQPSHELPSSTIPEPPPSTPKPEDENLTEEEKAARIKAEKIRIALQKMKEAQVRKLVIRIGLVDTSSKNLMVEEQQSVREVMDNLREKTHSTNSPDWCLVETNPDLDMERFYEDHENLVQNLVTWTRDTQNGLTFVERREKNALFKNPQNYLLGNKEAKDVKDRDKESLLEECFCGTSVAVPELEGELFLKEDGKKSWKRRYFLLRASGIYFVPKGKTKTLRDLTCFIQFENLNVYYCLDYKNKYKAPTDCCFALKHPQIQKKSQYIKYLCCDDARSLHQWVTGIRIAKYGKYLYDNFKEANRKAGEGWPTLANLVVKTPEPTPGVVADSPTSKGVRSTNTVSAIFSEAWKRGTELTQVHRENQLDDVFLPLPPPPGALENSDTAGAEMSFPPPPESFVQTKVQGPAPQTRPIIKPDDVSSPPPPCVGFPPPPPDTFPPPPPPAAIPQSRPAPAARMSANPASGVVVAVRAKKPPSVPQRKSSRLSSSDIEQVQGTMMADDFPPPPPPEEFMPPPPSFLPPPPKYYPPQEMALPPPPPCNAPTLPSFPKPHPPAGKAPQPPQIPCAPQLHNKVGTIHQAPRAHNSLPSAQPSMPDVSISAPPGAAVPPPPPPPPPPPSPVTSSSTMHVKAVNPSNVVLKKTPVNPIPPPKPNFLDDLANTLRKKQLAQNAGDGATGPSVLTLSPPRPIPPKPGFPPPSFHGTG